MSDRLRVLVTGAHGQVGSSLLASAPSSVDVLGAGHADLDISDGLSVSEFVSHVRPRVIINAAAYTAVDKAENEPQSAIRINTDGPANLARAARMVGSTRLIHISTDFVFDGRASVPYRVEDTPAPLNVYGTSKLHGERAVLEILPVASSVVRTAWIYSANGHNFVKTMLRLMNERDQINVVCDQVGTPTSAASLASVLWRFVDRDDLSGVFHWTDAGVASWYDFAVAIAEEAALCGLLRKAVTVNPIATTDYPTTARRPAYSVLDNRATSSTLGVKVEHWRTNLRAVIKELAIA